MSDIVSGSVVVGVLNILSVKGVSMLLGNDLARGKVIADTEVVMEPFTSAEMDMFEEEISQSSGIPFCGVTQAQASATAKDTRASMKRKDTRERDQYPSNNSDGKLDRD